MTKREVPKCCYRLIVYLMLLGSSCPYPWFIVEENGPSVETPLLASSLGPHSLQNCLTYFQVTPHHSSIISFIPHSSLCSFACPPLFQCSASLSHMSAPFSALGALGRPVQQSGIPYHFQLLPAPLFILSRKSLRLICLPQPAAFPSSWIVLDAPLIRWSPLIYLSGCLWFCACLNVCYYYYYYYALYVMNLMIIVRINPRQERWTI